MLFALAYAAIAVWTSGDALIAAAHRLLGTPVDNGMLALGYGIIAAEIVAVALFGHGTVVALQKFVLPVVAALLLLGVFAFGGRFVGGASSGDYLLGGFWPTWILAVVLSVGGPLSYAPDARRLQQADLPGAVRRPFDRRGHHGRHLLRAVPDRGFRIVHRVDLHHAERLLRCRPGSGAPGWYVLPIVLVALAGGLGQGVLNVYASGLDLEALIPRLRRVHTTLITSALAVALLYIGVFVVDAVDSITAMTLVLNGFAAPWVAINVAGFLVARRGQYDAVDLQVFNLGRKGGRYWFTGGWNLRAVIPWAAGSVFGVLAVDTSLYSGPLPTLRTVSMSVLSDRRPSPWPATSSRCDCGPNTWPPVEAPTS